MAVLAQCQVWAALPSKTEAVKAEPLIDVIVQPVVERQIHTSIEALGNLRANESIRLTPNVTKTITHIYFEDGQRVQKGQLLVEMTRAEEAALLQEAGVTASEAQKQLERVRSLAQHGAASESLLDQRLREYQAAQARYDALNSRLRDLRLVAPFGGLLGLRNVSVGALVAPGDEITTLNDDSKMKLDFTVPAVYLQSLHLGVPIRAQSRALQGKDYAGKIFSIDNQIDEVTRAIRVRALLDNPKHELKQGMLMLVELQAAEREALVISEAALVPLGSDNFVFVAHRDGLDAGQARLERRPITLGQRYPGAVEVTAGLAAGEQVVTHGLQKVRDAQLVNILSVETPAAVSSGVASLGAEDEHLDQLLAPANSAASSARD